MARALSRASQSKHHPNLASDDDLAVLIDQCSKNVLCGLSAAHYLCRLMHVPNRFGTLEQIDRATVDWLMTGLVTPLLEHCRAANETFPTVRHFVRAAADRTCAHEEALTFSLEVQMGVVCHQSLSDRRDMADMIVSDWRSIRDFLLQLKLPDLTELGNRITVESAKAIESQHHRTSQQPSGSAFAGDKMPREQDKPAVELLVEVPKRRATLRAETGEHKFDLPSEAVARWLKVLADHSDEWIRPADYKTHGGDDLDGVRPSDKLRSLKTACPMLAKLIEPSKHEGMRFNTALSLKFVSAPRCVTNR